jgi:hypothetical protein
MNIELFQEQIARLQEVYGKNAYPSERQKLMWRTFANTPDVVFLDAVNFLIMSKRATPLHKDFHDAITEAWEAKKNLERQAAQDRDMLGVLENAYDPKQYDDPAVRERIQGRIKLVRDFTGGRITKRQFDEGCDFYDRNAGIPTK